MFGKKKNGHGKPFTLLVKIIHIRDSLPKFGYVETSRGEDHKIMFEYLLFVLTSTQQNVNFLRFRIRKWHLDDALLKVN